VLIDAQRVGFGASGRNGGQLGSGQRKPQDALERLLGEPNAKALWSYGEDAKALVKTLIDKHKIDCDLRPGVAMTGERLKDVDWIHRYAAHLQSRYGYDQIRPMSRAEFHALCPSPRYRGGALDLGAAHLHPLKFALGLARAAKRAGVRIYEGTQAHHIQQRTPATVRTDRGRVVAEHVVLAGNGYIGTLNRRIAAHVMPINNFIVATEPLGARAADILTQDVAVCDSRFVVNYFRLSKDNRLLFGGGESYGYRFPKNIRALVSRPMREIFPALRDVPLTHAWGGTLAITAKRLPHFARLAPNILTASGYSGHGIGNAVQAGALMAKAIQGDSDGFNTFCALPTTPFPGGAALRSTLLATAMSWFALRDRIGF
jgi:gamma-glutamylputrescine oxidase